SPDGGTRLWRHRRESVFIGPKRASIRAARPSRRTRKSTRKLAPRSWRSSTISARGLTVHRQNFYLSNLRTLARLLGRSFANPTRADLERVLAKIEKSDYEYWTKVNFRTSLKRFYKWHLGNDEEYPEVVRWIRTKNGGRAREKLPTDLLSQEEVEKLVDACTHARDKALVSLLYDSG